MISFLQAKHNFLVKWMSWYVMSTCLGRLQGLPLYNFKCDLCPSRVSQKGKIAGVVQYLKWLDHSRYWESGAYMITTTCIPTTVVNSNLI